MSINTILNNGLSGLLVNQQALRITADNVSNVNTDGYIKKTVQFQNRVAGSTSAGVEIADVQRIVDKFLQTASYSASADGSRYKAMSDMQDRLQSLFGSPSDNSSFAGKIDAVFAAVSNASLDPSTIVNRQSLISAITDFGSTAGRVSGQIQDLRLEASNRISEDVASINSALEQINKLNPLIIRQKQMGGDSSALEEARQRAINQVSKLVDIRVEDAADGSVRIATTSGVSLLDGALYKLSYNGPGTVTSDTTFSPISVTRIDPVTGQETTSVTSLDPSLKSGEIKGLLDMRNNVLPDLADQVGELAGKFADTINAAHNASTAYPPPASLTGKNTGLLSTDLQGFTGKTEFAALDSSGKVVNSVTIDFGAMPAGSTIADVVNAVNAGLGGAATMSFNNGVMSFTGAGGNKVAIGQMPGAGSDRGGHGFSQFFGLNDLVSADVPSNFDTGFSATDANGFTPGGTMSLQLIGPGGDIASSYNLTMAGGSFNTILSDLNANMGGKVTFSMDSNGALVETPAPGYEGYGIHVVSDSTSRGSTGTSFSQLFGLGNPYTADAANGLGVTSTITNDQNRVALGTLDTTAAVGSYALAAGDNSGAQALANVANQTVNFADFGDLKSIHGTLNQYAAMVLSNAGLKAAQADQLAQDAQSLSQEINQRQSDASGVNLDEELSNMIVYQNAYAAAGRVIKTAQDVYNSLLQAVS